MKLALLFSGQPRFVKETFDSIKENIINQYDIDVFAHLWFDSNLTSNPFKGYRGDDKVISKNSIEDFVNLYNPKEIIVDESRNFSNKNLKIKIEKYWGEVCKDIPDFEKQIINNSLSHFYSMGCVNTIKKNYEYKNDFKYDMVVSLRTDVIINEKINFENYDKSLVHFSNINNQPDGMICDWINFSSSENMDLFMSIYNNFESLVNISEKKTGAWCNELLHKFALDSFGIDRMGHKIKIIRV